MAMNKMIPKTISKGPTKSKAGAGSQPLVASSSKSSGALRPRQASALPAGPQSSASEFSTLAATLQRLEEMEARLLKEQGERQELEAVISAFRTEEQDENTAQAILATGGNMIPRPAGTAGADWSLQMKMRLSDSDKKSAKYAGLLRGLRDLVHNAGIKWEVGWKEIPAADKTRLFAVARERYPILKQYSNDWATAEIVKQYLKNKRAHQYHNGWLEVPEKYAYLKQNASKRSPTGSRVKRAKVELAAKKKGKRHENLVVHQRRVMGGEHGVGMDGEGSNSPQEDEDVEDEDVENEDD